MRRHKFGPRPTMGNLMVHLLQNNVDEVVIANGNLKLGDTVDQEHIVIESDQYTLWWDIYDAALSFSLAMGGLRCFISWG